MVKINKLNEILTEFGKEKVKDISEWKKVKPTSKKDLKYLKENPPNNFVNFVNTSGTTGENLYIYYSKESNEAFIERCIETFEMAGITEKDKVLDLFAYGPWVVGSLMEKAFLRANIPNIPLGSPNITSQDEVLEYLRNIQPTVWATIPSYGGELLNKIEKSPSLEARLEDKDLDKEDLFPRLIYSSGEMLLDTYIEKFQSRDIEVANHYGLSELPVAAMTTTKNPKKFKALEKGTYIETHKTDKGKELLVTDLKNKATPVIRYRTQDLVKNVTYNSDGSVSEFELIGRYGDLTKIQSFLVSKQNLTDTLRRFTKDFKIKIKTIAVGDYVEVNLPKNLKEQKERILSQLKSSSNLHKGNLHARVGLNFKNEVKVPTASSNKKKYVIDERNK